MTTPPLWLPPALVLPKDLAESCRRLRDQFNQDFIDNPCDVNGSPIRWDKDETFLEGISCEKGFHHLITKEVQSKGRHTTTRRYDFERARRLPWCRAVLLNTTDAAVRTWQEPREHGPRTYYWLAEQNYVVLVDYRSMRVMGTDPPQRREVAWLVSAYWTNARGKESLEQSFRRNTRGR